MNMLTESPSTTIAICENFFKECEQHWLRDLKAGRIERDVAMSPLQQSRMLALRDIQALKRNPNSPFGELLHESAKLEAINNLIEQYELVHN